MHLEEYAEDTQEIEGEYNPPILKRRATVGHDYTAPAPKLVAVPREKPKKHYLFSVGIGMCIFLALFIIWNMVVVPWWHGLQLQWHYGDNQVSVMGADVGHGGTSRFIAFDSENDIVVVEVVQKRSIVYIIPTGKVQNKLITLSVVDGDHAGKPNLVVQVDGQEGVFILFNTGDAFSLTK